MVKKIWSLLVIVLVYGNSYAQSLYDEATIQEIEITFAQSNWDALLDAEKAGNDGYIMAQSVSVNGVVFDSVGVKYKGNSTYNPNQTKNPFHIELDTYKEQEYDGYTDIKLSNAYKDPSFIREVLSYKILRNYMDAPLSNYANVYVNGALMGLYSNSESVSKKFVNKNFGSKTNTFIKCNPPGGAGGGNTNYPNLVYISQDSSQYYDKYELKSDAGWGELIDLCDTLKNEIGSIEDILDLDRALWMLAFDNIFVNLDSYIGGFAQNYYLYRDDNGRFIPVVWDLNESFGTFSRTGNGNLNGTTAKQQMSHLLHENDASFPLISQLLSIPSYKKMYLAHCKTILEDNFTNNGPYYAAGQVLQNTINSAVQADQNKFYTYTNFLDNLTSDVTSGGGPGATNAPGLTNLMNGRYAYLMGLNDFTATQPVISSITLSNSQPAVNDIITITANVVDENTVYLGYRGFANKPFQKVNMYDDGNHNDGAANDNVYGVDISVPSTETQYYIYAENNTIGKFSPTNAEHEFHTLTAISQPIGDVVINEFLASNTTANPDQDGEYDDWVEIYNKGNSTIDISNYRLTDDPGDPAVFSFPAGTTIDADDYIVVWADKDLTQAGFHADFKLSASGEAVYLMDSNLTIVDSIVFPAQVTDTSYGRFPNGTGPFQTMMPTFAAQNMLLVAVEEEAQASTELSVYPNPASESFTIALSEASFKEVKVSIFDSNGRLVHNDFILQRANINTSNWPAGLYFVVVGNTSQKVIVN